VRLWPTPTVAGNYNKKGLSKNSGNGLYTAVQKTEDNRAPLNPEWVEWLMGWPIGWTDLRPKTIFKWELRPCAKKEPKLSRQTKIKGATKRLKIIGNGQVPIVMAFAMILLSTAINEK